MKYVIIFPLSLLLMGCGDNNQVKNNENQSCIQNNNDSIDTTIKIINIDETEKQNDTMKINDIFTDTELSNVRGFLAKWNKRRSFDEQLQYVWQYENETGEDTGEKYKVPSNLEMTDEDVLQELDITYRILNKKIELMYQKVSDSLFHEKMKYVFGIDIDTINDKLYYTNNLLYYDEGMKRGDAFVFDFRNKFFLIGYQMAWRYYDFFHKISYETYNEIYDKKLPYLQECDALIDLEFSFYDKAVAENYEVVANKDLFKCLAHLNNYVFHDSKASFQWLKNSEIGISYLVNLFEIFDYDKDIELNRMMLDKIDVSNGFPINEPYYSYENLFADLDGSIREVYYSYTFHVRTGLMQFVVDNCYDEKDVDKAKIRRDRYISIMQDCFEYLVGEHWNSDDSKKKERTYETCAYMGYYLQKAYDKYVSHGNGAPRTWDYALMNALKKDQEKNNSEFIQYVRNHQYMGLDGYKDIFEKAVEGITD